MKKLILSLFMLISLSSAASELYAIDEIYFLGEILHSSRHDYDGGMKVSFNAPEPSFEKFGEECEIVSPVEVVQDFQKVVEVHLGAYFDDEFDFDYSLALLSHELRKFKKLKKCHLRDGIFSYKSLSNLFLVSYKIL